MWRFPGGARLRFAYLEHDGDADQGHSHGDEHASADGLIPRGALVRYREWYGAAAPNVGLKLPAEAVADRIRELERDDGRAAYGVLDPAAFASDGRPLDA